jgi:hypothetical protein
MRVVTLRSAFLCSMFDVPVFRNTSALNEHLQASIPLVKGRSNDILHRFNPRTETATHASGGVVECPVCGA